MRRPAMTAVDAQERSLDHDSILTFHPLARREDGDELVVGRADSDAYIALPSIGGPLLDLLGQGLPVREVERRIEAATGERIDVLDLAENLVDCHLVAAVDGRQVPGPPPIRPTFPRLTTERVAWLLRRPVGIVLDLALAAVVLAAVATAAAVRAPLLDFQSLLWSDSGSVVILTQVAIAWSLVCIHETAHLVTARAAGVPGRITFGTRLQFLVAQTNVTGVWAAPRRHRLAVYSAGMKSDALAASLAVLSLTATEPGGLAHRLAIVVAITAMTSLGLQLLIFMRTDVYFIVQDLTGSRNLYGDSASYAKYLAARAVARTSDGHPLAALGDRERRVVQGYTALLVAGTAICLAYAAAVYLPYQIGLLRDASASVLSGRFPEAADGLVVLAILATVFTIWARAWWSRHGARLRAALAARRRRDG
jgi:hypothetical protein